ncbi:MAG: 2-phospho-L-lactate transferase [Methanoregulaceae archaeon]
MITVLSGGTGTPKLLRGLKNILREEEIAVIVNTAEDIRISGGYLSPDVDTVMYLFAGLLNTDTWWGIRNDTFVTHDELVRLGRDEFIALGDRDRAVNLARAELLDSGMTLTQVTEALCGKFGVRAEVLPMADTPVTTMVQTAYGPIHFQEYWVKERGKVPILGVQRVGKTPSQATREVLSAIERADAVIIGPSNPITSILPIIECTGVPEALRKKFVVAVSPFIGDTPFSGPAAALMTARGQESSSRGTVALYKDFISLFIQDVRDTVEIPGALKFDTLMSDEAKSTALAEQVLGCIRNPA